MGSSAFSPSAYSSRCSECGSSLPIAIVSIAAQIGPWEAVQLSLGDPEEYERIVSSAHIGIAGFGGAFLAMVGLSFFFDSDKDVHWIASVEQAINRFFHRACVEIGMVLSLVYGVVDHARAR